MDCGGNARHALEATDLLIQAGGFGLVVLDLGDTPPETARRIPLASWVPSSAMPLNAPSAALLALGLPEPVRGRAPLCRSKCGARKLSGAACSSRASTPPPARRHQLAPTAQLLPFAEVYGKPCCSSAPVSWLR